MIIKLIFRFGNFLTEKGDKYHIRFLTYNPIIWAFFFVTSRREGKVFASALIDVFQDIKSAADVGSGGGGYVAALRDKGIRSVGYEYAWIGRLLGKLQGVRIYPFDCSDEAIAPRTNYDIVFSIEVGEHIPKELTDPFVNFLCACSDVIVFSAAHPGQGGHGHINEQTKAFWQGKFIERGFCSLPGEETNLREYLIEHGYRGWLPRNLQVFSKI